MIRTTFERKLQQLQDQIIMLGSEVQANIVKSAEALIERDLVCSQQLIDADQAINDKRIQLSLDGLTLLARQQPMASDLRLIIAVLEIVGELERIHDYVKGIGKISLLLGEHTIMPSIQGKLLEMAYHARDMLRRSLQAFVERDADLARAIPATDELVDKLYKQCYREIIDFVREDSAEIEQASRLEWAVHNLERSADRVTNICEWVVYLVDGYYAEMDSEFEAPPNK